MELCWKLEMSAESPRLTEDAENRLVLSAQRGDPAAFSELVRLHQRRVFRLAGRFFRDRFEVEDVAQETFLRAWRKLRTFRARAPFEHWLTRVCLNCCYERLRQRRPLELPLDTDVLAQRRPDPDARLEVEKLLRTLKPEERFILLLLDGEGWSVAEIAERLGWTPVNVRVRAHRVRKKLRRLLEREQP